MRRTSGLIAVWVAVLLLGGPASGEGSMDVTELRLHTHIHGLAADPADPLRLFVATHHGLYVADQSGRAKLVSPVQDFMGFVLSPGDGQTLYASGHPAEGGNLGVMVSTDGGATWRQISPGADGPVDFHQMTVSPADPRVMYGAYGYLQVSRDGGSTWAKVGRAPTDLIDLAAAASDRDRVYAATESGLLVSSDGGISWQPAGFEGEPVTMIEAAHGRLYVAVLGGGLMVAEDVDEPRWSKFSDGPGGVVLHFAAGPERSGRFYVADHRSTLFTSADGGASWRQLGR